MGAGSEGYGSRLTIIDSAIVDNVDSYGGGGISAGSATS